MVRGEFQTVDGVKNGGRHEYLKSRIFLAEFDQAGFRPKALGTVLLRNEGAVSAVPRRHQPHVRIFPDRGDTKLENGTKGSSCAVRISVGFRMAAITRTALDRA